MHALVILIYTLFSLFLYFVFSCSVSKFWAARYGVPVHARQINHFACAYTYEEGKRTYLGDKKNIYHAKEVLSVGTKFKLRSHSFWSLSSSETIKLSKEWSMIQAFWIFLYSIMASSIWNSYKVRILQYLFWDGLNTRDLS